MYCIYHLVDQKYILLMHRGTELVDFCNPLGLNDDSLYAYMYVRMYIYVYLCSFSNFNN